jgi:putative ABC transport system permease protein
VLQFALSAVLLVAAGLLLKSFHRLQHVDPGFTASGLLSFKISPDHSRYGQEQARLGFFGTVEERLRALPGVTHVAFTSGLPMDTTGRTSLNVFPDGPSALSAGESVQTHWRIISPEYFATLQVPLVRGRAFAGFDTTQSAASIIISEKLAHRFWPGEDALGRKVNPGGGDNLYTVVGVVRDTNLRELAGDSYPAMYFPLTRWWGWDTMAVVVRTAMPPEALAADVRRVMSEIDPGQPIFDLRPVAGVVAAQLQPARLHSSLLVIFGGLALGLAAVGVYGVMAARVAERRSEIGVRLALGAQVADIMRLVLGQGLRLAALGLALGLAGALATNRLLASLLYDTPSTDPLAFGGAALLLTLAAVIACWLPARRASRVSPLEALRAE